MPIAIGSLVVAVITLLIAAAALYLQNRQLQRGDRNETDYKQIDADQNDAVACLKDFIDLA